ncbi:FMN-dependent NADH-azoreductase [Cupriavidus metallidurans]|jgi:FMN-dependent NADH-azoreductase|uniref:FMN dependent NADH:quinone oxidoreductase n=1 Tax=Cupriavidus metallidurans (strain ATCC 43123 / DSM 2839 / NBRC 102507 / CH34) TaxID=266264 RepID=Q1LHR6_CUPMC|nr:NAD(P)H-dependent oxidoreductase [Cupriavidus metallidurans]ABF10310.1 FMN-dependent NADH-azoreductase 2 (FMN-dependent NADH-azo compound oxidoreductase 2) (Azo-dye reductase 2) [Cupriavidus metallidurans CH34]KWW33689.1 FMN-dependent NADH-azoreductase [Cupriavidus metallidurans]MDE4919767.1 NAD(P)H-dependent oxidoreductase [Cupriavidus metallidurans]QGS28919.1 FMN-dependent NADH-azoreductase [Cupriavidus metallidurans]
MTTLLHLNVSPRGERSHSRQAGSVVRERLAAHRGPLTVIERDLGAEPLPPIDAAFTDANLAVAAGGDEQAPALMLSERLIAELESADMVLITTPIHNFTVPATLKTWIDVVVRPGRTFRSTPQGKQGLLRDRPVLAVVACGGAFHDGPGSQQDFFTPYLKYVLGTIGLSRVEVLRMENMNRGSDPVARSFDHLRAWCEAAVPAMVD